jgi:uncharacterized membrane protein YfbV (UPF0208 family)
MAVTGTTLTQTNLPAGIVTAVIGLGLVFAGIYVTAKGIVTEAVQTAAKAKTKRS